MLTDFFMHPASVAWAGDPGLPISWLKAVDVGQAPERRALS